MFRRQTTYHTVGRKVVMWRSAIGVELKAEGCYRRATIDVDVNDVVRFREFG